ncbi:hypothetical protein BH11PSE11_BH11PSE11_31060 [soil metagenome]
MNLKMNLTKQASVLLLLTLLSTSCFSEGSNNQGNAVTEAKSGKALYEEKCRTVAGEKIYRKVENVEGIVLLKVRPQASDREWADRMWPGAAFALEAGGSAYIDTFLGYEYAPADGLTGKPGAVTPAQRGYITTDKYPDGLPGYRYVDVIDDKDGKRYRYSGSLKVVGRKDETAPGVQMALKKDPNFDMNVRRWVLDKTLATTQSPQYGVTFEDHVIPQDRAVGVASSTIKVVDLKTNEVLGEMTRYAWSPGGPSNANPSPWLTAWKCPGHPVGASAATRKFVDQILIPKKAQQP